jgi:holo-[acyl-carrier protein] synthase
VGADLVDVASFQKRFDGRGDLLAEIFTESELAYARSQHRAWVHLAARFAAKEAALKAFGTGLAGAIAWRDIEVTRDAAGRPGLAFHGAIVSALAREGLARSSVSLSHTDDHALAVVLLHPA